VTYLLDANILIALVDPDHLHHWAAADWFSATDAEFATCPITQGALVRHLFRSGHSAGDIGSAVTRIQALPRHTFWPDDRPFITEIVAGMTGHRQVSDAYLCHLVRQRRQRIATFDRGLAALHSDVAELVPIG
jgi:uncharacterized protein